MEKWIMTVESNCADPSREEEYNEWYNNVHLPDILETPGFIRAARYENSAPDESNGKYLAMYEIETDDLGQTMVAFATNVDNKTNQGRMSDLVMAVGGGMYRLLHSAEG